MDDVEIKSSDTHKQSQPVEEENPVISNGTDSDSFPTLEEMI